MARWRRAEGLAVDVHEVEDRHVARAILQVAIDVAADLIAKTARERRAVAGLPLGGVASEVLRAVLMPVLLVRSGPGSGGG